MSFLSSIITVWFVRVLKKLYCVREASFFCLTCQSWAGIPEEEHGCGGRVIERGVVVFASLIAWPRGIYLWIKGTIALHFPASNSRYNGETVKVGE